MGSSLKSSPAAPWFRNPHLYPWPSRAVSRIVFESSWGCIETTSDVANALANPRFATSRGVSLHANRI